MKNPIFLPDSKPHGPEAGSDPPEAGSGPLGQSLYFKKWAQPIKRKPSVRRGPRMQTICLLRFLPFYHIPLEVPTSFSFPFWPLQYNTRRTR